MEPVDRRSFLKYGSLIAGSAGVLTMVPMGLGAAEAVGPAATGAVETDLPEGATLAEGLVVHVADLSSGAINLFSGVEQVTIHDPQLAARLFRAFG